MPKVTAPTEVANATFTFEFAGERTTIAARYTEGHVLTAAEATLLNRAWIDAAKRSFSTTLTAMHEREPPAEPAEILDEFLNHLDHWEYKPRTPADPITAMRLTIAKEEVHTAARAKGYIIKDLDPARLAATIEAHEAAHRARLDMMARARIRTMTEFVGSKALAGLSIPEESDPS